MAGTDSFRHMLVHCSTVIINCSSPNLTSGESLTFLIFDLSYLRKLTFLIYVYVPFLFYVNVSFLYKYTYLSYLRKLTFLIYVYVPFLFYVNVSFLYTYTYLSYLRKLTFLIYVN